MEQNFDGVIITESSYEAKPKILHDSVDVTIIETILQEAEAPNRNGRIYSKSALLSGINAPMVQEKIKKKTFVGECGHPLSDDIRRQTYIDQTRISHIVTDAHFEGNILKGIVESANTCAGRDFQGLCRQGMNMAFSMRGLGGASKKEGMYDRIDGKLFIISYDWVIYPSHGNAYQERILKEDANIAMDKQMLLEGATFACNLKEFVGYIAESSKNVQELAEHMKFGIEYDNISIDKDTKTLDIKNESNEILKVFLEDDMKAEIDNLFGKFKF